MSEMTVYEAAMRRVSVRDYSGTGLTAAQREKLAALCGQARAEFGGKVSITLAAFGDGGTQKPGTYGVIRGARDFFIVGTDGSDEARLSAGYAMECIVLEATRLGLGTCWLAATFRGSAFARAAALPEGMEVEAVVPVGTASGKRHLLERITRAMVRETSRMPAEKLFVPPVLHAGSRFGRALEAVRRAPSSVNSQPWRAVVDKENGAVHFYYSRRSAYVMLDMGIALCHFAEVLAEEGIAGEYAQVKAPEMDKWTYLRSFIVK